MDECIFCKIAKKEIPADVIYEDSNVMAFLDIMPISKGHALVIPKKHSENILDIGEEDLKKLIVGIKKTAKAVLKGTGAEGINVSMNNNRAAGQLVFHTHFHIIPRFSDDGLKHWPQGRYAEGESAKIAAKIIKEF
ncbi:HIT family protein [Candidatus Woesearchaeota archaeon]|nr:HIT family protein [Candidatus Woesearchaeota archaeon]MBW3017407.1 HIT family protein [Candidatus Woesearchaeota archaeon]